MKLLGKDLYIDCYDMIKGANKLYNVAMNKEMSMYDK